MLGSGLTGLMGLTELGCAIGFYGLWALLWKVFYKSYPSKVVKQIFQDGRMLYVISPNLSHCYAVLRFLHSWLKGQHISQLYHFAVKEYEKCYDVFLTFFSVKTLPNLFNVFAVVTFLQVMVCSSMFKRM